jgi:E3 ubiquitin-protein ligase SHPRH
MRSADDSAELVFAWREKIIQLLSSPIEAEPTDVQAGAVDVEDPSAEYYAQALQAQGDG